VATAVTDAEREQLAAIPASYFRAVDARDLSAVRLTSPTMRP
jgi:hypothetical protein